VIPFLLPVMLQAAPPPPGLPYDARTDYRGPGLVCGSAFRVLLLPGETAILTKRSFVDAETSFATKDGPFTVSESQYAAPKGKRVRRTAEGMLWRLGRTGSYRWIYTDLAPGHTAVSGTAVGAGPGRALDRVTFGTVRSRAVGGRPCLDGVGSDRRMS